jgi:hypothetical protein
MATGMLNQAKFTKIAKQRNEESVVAGTPLERFPLASAKHAILHATHH